MATGIEIVNLALTQAGDPYVFGAEASAANANPRAFDCSELVEWVCNRLGVRPVMPDGARAQKNHCQMHGTLIWDIDRAIKIPGTLLFRMGSSPTTDHVAINRGNGQTIEARGRAYGVGSFSAYNRNWTHAAFIPGVNYRIPQVVTPPSAPPVDWAAVRRYGAAQWLPFVQALINNAAPLGPTHGTQGEIKILQQVINFITNRGLKEDGVYGDATAKAVVDFQSFFNIRDVFPGVAGAPTLFVMACILMNIRDGKAT